MSTVTLMGRREFRTPLLQPSLLLSPSSQERWTSQMLCLVNNALILGYEIKSLPARKKSVFRMLEDLHLVILVLADSAAVMEEVSITDGL